MSIMFLGNTDSDESIDYDIANQSAFDKVQKHHSLIQISNPAAPTPLLPTSSSSISTFTTTTAAVYDINSVSHADDNASSLSEQQQSSYGNKRSIDNGNGNRFAPPLPKLSEQIITAALDVPMHSSIIQQIKEKEMQQAQVEQQESTTTLSVPSTGDSLPTEQRQAAQKKTRIASVTSQSSSTSVIQIPLPGLVPNLVHNIDCGVTKMFAKKFYRDQLVMQCRECNMSLVNNSCYTCHGCTYILCT